MLEIVETLEFKHVYPYNALLWLTQDAYVSTTEGLEGWHVSFKLNDGSIVKASPQKVYKAIELLTSNLFYELINEKRAFTSIQDNNKEKRAFHEGKAIGIRLAIQIQYEQHIWILATRIYENMTGIDRGEL